MAIKTAVLGYGRSGSTLHADPIEFLQDFEMTAVCDIDPLAQSKAKNRFKCRIYSDYRDMLLKEELDLVVIVTRSDQHCRMTCDCLKSGKNVLVTKPWAVTADEAGEMIEAAKVSGKMLLPWLPARWGCDFEKLKEIISSGMIGRVFQVRRSEFSFGIRSDWQTQKKFGGGYLLNWGPHLVDQPVQLLGQPIKTVYGEMKQIINPGDVEDVFHAVMKTEMDATIVSEFTIGAEKLPNWVIQGAKGTIFVKGKDIEIHRIKYPEVIDPSAFSNRSEVDIIHESADGTNRISMDNRYGDPLVIYPHIARAVLGKEPYKVTAESALYLSKLLDAIRLSHKTSEIIRIPHFLP
jgi:scyllo-inositol 2-dehydrogenase (NADP+)